MSTHAVFWNEKIGRHLRCKINSINYLSKKHMDFYLKQDKEINYYKHSGAYSVYYKIGNGIGIKVIKSPWRQVLGYSTRVSCLRSSDWKDAYKEFSILLKLCDSEFTPIPFSLKPIRVGSRWFPSIFMQHIKGHVYYLGTAPKSIERGIQEVINKLVERLKIEYNIECQDHRGHNAILSPDMKVYLIDFTSSTTNEL